MRLALPPRPWFAPRRRERLPRIAQIASSMHVHIDRGEARFEDVRFGNNQRRIRDPVLHQDRIHGAAIIHARLGGQDRRGENHHRQQATWTHSTLLASSDERSIAEGGQSRISRRADGRQELPPRKEFSWKRGMIATLEPGDRDELRLSGLNLSQAARRLWA